ncbi:TolC family protein [Geofilum rubicundum]|uniref:Outer membrane efflux protein n=1 Tax=Geofilum rubicundum JCM 15548 TaxID=1236989 RepID=A0A0E9LQY2_9BACT|nr:TolC family protein [Geofilum rubicundum]GAO27708.1 outer membrane efflux protein [Geofilum rubicundum JCM 15548]
MKYRNVITPIVLLLSLNINAQTVTLEMCKDSAIQNNINIKNKQLSLEASQEVKKNAFTNYFPQIDAGAVAVKLNKSLVEAELPEMNLPVYDGNPANLAAPTQFTYFPGMGLELLDYVNAGYLTAVQPLYVGGRIRNGNKLASLGVEFSQHQLNLTQDEVLVATEFYYWTILALEEKKKTLEGYEKLLNSLKNDVSVAYEAGLIQKSDLLKIQLELNNINANKLKLNNGIDLLKMTLAQHIGITYSGNLQIADTAILVHDPVETFWSPEEALLKRDEYQMLNKAIDAEILQKKMAMGEYLPTVAVGVAGLYLDVSEPDGGMMSFNNTNSMVFAKVSVPISGWWGGSHKIKEHKLKVNIAQNNLEEKTELLKLQMDKAYKDVIESYMQIQVAESSVEQALEHLSVVKNSFDAGVVSTSDLLEAQAMYQQTKDALIDSKTAYKIKYAEYLKVTGRLL